MENWWRYGRMKFVTDLRLSLFSMAHQKAQEPSIVQRRSLGVGLEEWGVVAKWSGEVLSHHFTLTIFGNLGVFFVSFLLLYHCFVILIKYSRAQRGKRLSPPIISPSVTLELKGYLSDLRIYFVFALWKLYKTSLKERLKPQWTWAFAYARS